MAEVKSEQPVFIVNYHLDRIEFVIGEGKGRKRVKFDPFDFKIVGKVSDRLILDHAYSRDTNPHEVERKAEVEEQDMNFLHS